jgi:hypothetical protein
LLLPLLLLLPTMLLPQLAAVVRLLLQANT